MREILIWSQVLEQSWHFKIRKFEGSDKNWFDFMPAVFINNLIVFLIFILMFTCLSMLSEH